MSIRLKRLQSDYEQLQERFRHSRYIAIRKATGNPPERYEVEYRVNGLVLQENGQITESGVHVAEIVLTRAYPRLAPQCKMLTPIFHPNIDYGAICIGDHWAAAESLADLVIRIGEMITYQQYNVKSPLNGEAARWAAENKHLLPVQAVDLAPPEPEATSAPPEADKIRIIPEAKRSSSDDIAALVEKIRILPQDVASTGRNALPACASCGKDNPEEARFCRWCGAALFGECPSCGATDRVGMIYCGACGIHMARFKEALCALDQAKAFLRIHKHNEVIAEAERGLATGYLKGELEEVQRTAEQEREYLRTLRQSIDDLIEGDEYDEARSLIRQALSVDPSCEDILILERDLPKLISKKQWDKTLVLIENSGTLDEESCSRVVDQIHTALRLGASPDAEDALPLRAQLISSAEALIERNAYQLALHILSAVRELTPASNQHALRQRDRADALTAWIEKRQEINRLTQGIMMLDRERRYEELGEPLRRALELDSSLADFAVMLRELPDRIRRRDMAARLDQARRAKEFNNFVVMLDASSSVLEQEPEDAEARRLLADAERLRDDHSSRWINAIELRDDELERCVEKLHSLAKDYPWDSSVAHELSKCKELLERIRTLRSDAQDALHNKHLTFALETWRKLLELSPKDSEAREHVLSLPLKIRAKRRRWIRAIAITITVLAICILSVWAGTSNEMHIARAKELLAARKHSLAHDEIRQCGWFWAWGAKRLSNDIDQSEFQTQMELGSLHESMEQYTSAAEAYRAALALRVDPTAPQRSLDLLVQRVEIKATEYACGLDYSSTIELLGIAAGIRGDGRYEGTIQALRTGLEEQRIAALAELDYALACWELAEDAESGASFVGVHDEAVALIGNGQDAFGSDEFIEAAEAWQTAEAMFYKARDVANERGSALAARTEARSAQEAASEADSAKYASTRWGEAEAAFRDGQESFDAGQYGAAYQQWQTAKKHYQDAHGLAGSSKNALTAKRDAEEDREQARKSGAVQQAGTAWARAEEILEKAQQRFDQGDYAISQQQWKAARDGYSEAKLAAESRLAALAAKAGAESARSEAVEAGAPQSISSWAEAELCNQQGREAFEKSSLQNAQERWRAAQENYRKAKIATESRNAALVAKNEAELASRGAHGTMIGASAQKLVSEAEATRANAEKSLAEGDFKTAEQLWKSAADRYAEVRVANAPYEAALAARADAANLQKSAKDTGAGKEIMTAAEKDMQKADEAFRNSDYGAARQLWLAASMDYVKALLLSGPKPGIAIGNTIGISLAYIPSGQFLMGSPESEPGRTISEGQHWVKLTRSFCIGTTEVTQAQWKAVMGNNPGRFQGDRRPVEFVSWAEAVEFCRKLSAFEGQHYRLPTEAEWEYACRAGSRSPFSCGSSISTEAANYDGNYPYAGGAKGVFREATTEAGSFSPNGWGLYDMHGNVWEWCNDLFEAYPKETVSDPASYGDEEYPRVIRGGSWNDSAGRCRSAFRFGAKPTERFPTIGFRVVLTLE